MTTKNELSKESLQYFLDNFRHKKIMACVTRVARSGMSRRISFAAINNAGEIERLNFYLSKLLGLNLNDDGLKVSGCGMDMIFHTLTCLNYAIGKIEGIDIFGIGGASFSYDKYFIDANNYITL
jgi:hypothetical protein